MHNRIPRVIGSDIVPSSTLAEEEPDVTAVALRPGMVDTSVRSDYVCDPPFCSHLIVLRCKLLFVTLTHLYSGRTLMPGSCACILKASWFDLKTLGTLLLPWHSRPRRTCPANLWGGTRKNASHTEDLEQLYTSSESHQFMMVHPCGKHPYNTPSMRFRVPLMVGALSRSL